MKKSLLFISASCLLLSLASCGGGGETTTSSAPEGTSSQPSSSLEPTSSSDSLTTSDSPTTEESSTVPSQQSSVAPSEDSSSQENFFLITFLDIEGEVIEAKMWREGVVPSCDYSVDDTQEWDYTFEGWSKTLGGEVITLPAVTEEATYYAVVTKVKQRYTVTFDSAGGSAVESITDEYGASIEEPSEPTYDGHSFVAWTYDAAGEQVVEWPLTLTEDVTLYANWNETIDIKGFLASLIEVTKQDPFGYIPAAMLPNYSDNLVVSSEIAYDFNSFVNVGDIRYGGFGEQWDMVIGNIIESERFYAILSAGETLISATVILFNDYLDTNPGTTASHSIGDTTYTATLDYHEGVLSYVLQYKTGWNVPFFGEILPQIDMTYDVVSGERSVRIQLTENNAMRYVVNANRYAFAVEYGVSTLSRKAYCEMTRSEEGEVEGHIAEFVQWKDKELVPAAADFYIGSEYVSVVGNKADGIPGFTGYINELYRADEGRLLGYEIRETFTKWGFESTYHTLWFNLCDIAGINCVKAVKNDSSTYGLGGENNHDVYLNGSASIFTPAYNTKLGVKTSRKYDVEMRKQSFFGYEEDQLTEFQIEIPMMFIQADHDGYTNFSDFPKDMKAKSGIEASVSLEQEYLDKIQADYATLIDVFIENKGTYTSDYITGFIGTVTEIGE